MLKSKKFRKFLSLLVILVLAGGLLFQLAIGTQIMNIISNIQKSTTGSFDPFALISGQTKLKGQDEGRTNILLYGINEFDGDGKGTVDTNIILSYFHQDKKISTISVMRDINVKQYSKINAVYPALSQTSNGSEQVQQLAYQEYMSDLTGVTIHYSVRVYMQSVVDLVNKLGGIDIDVRSNFFDEQYPKFNDYSVMYCPDRKRYDDFLCPSPTFIKGNTKMDGATALIYARSRKGQCFDLINGKKTNIVDQCIENGDEARGFRQNIVIQAAATKLKSDVASKKIVFDLNYLSGLTDVMGQNIKTNMSLNELYSLGTIIKDNVDPSKIKKININYKNTLVNKSNPNSSLLFKAVGSSDVVFVNSSVVNPDGTDLYNTRFKEIYQKPFEEPEVVE
jgi:anionic cell wall polymer biosynthesis LytR-Cps2A-Psr (LCP) family protein